MMMGLREQGFFKSQTAVSEKVAQFKMSSSVRVEGESTLSICKGPRQAAARRDSEVVAGHGTCVCQQRQGALCLFGLKKGTLGQLSPPKGGPNCPGVGVAA